jgi:hypothetical protein
VSTFDRSQAHRYMDMVFGRPQADAWIAARIGRAMIDGDGQEERLRLDPAGRTGFLDMAEQAVRAGRDVWVCPMPRATAKRSKDNGLPGELAWADVDHALTPEQAALVAELGAGLVESGSAGHLQVYVALAHATVPAIIEALNRGLRDTLEGDHKHANNSLMRLPGTPNTKPGAGPAHMVGPSPRRWYPDALAERLEVELKSEAPVEVEDLPPAKPFDVEDPRVPARTRDLILEDTPKGERSNRRDFPVTKDLRRVGFTAGQIRGAFENPQWPLGSKYREPKQGPRYLARTMARAERELAREAEPDRPRAFDVNNPPAGKARRSTIAEDLVLEGGTIAIVGEEGDGKTTILHQLFRQVLRGEPAFGVFSPGDLAVHRALILDVEQEEPEVLELAADMDRRSLAVADGSLFILPAGSLNLADSGQDRRYVRDALTGIGGAQLLGLDSGSDAVEDVNDHGQVRRLFDYFSSLQREQIVRSVVLVLHPRKRGQGEYGRRFDDTFGSREWKGRLAKALYIDGTRVVAWKDRGGHLRRRWPRRQGARYSEAVLERPGLQDDHAVPFVIAEQEAAASGIAEAKVREILAAEPDTYTKTTLAARLGIRQIHALGVIEGMIAAGKIGPNVPRAKLRVMAPSPQAPGGKAS